MNKRWQTAVQALHEQGEPFVMVTVIGVQGSAPRDSGTKMLVSANELYGSIGGGNLEHQSIKIAKELLKNKQPQQKVEYFPLSAKLGQCCAGAVSVLFESFPTQLPKIALFGAGHVSTALVKILSELDYRIEWIDQREQEFPKQLDSMVTMNVAESPADEVSKFDDDTIFLVMTHNHDLDFDICMQVLKRKHVLFLGLIGSKTKALRFRKKMAHLGLNDEQINSLVSPIGLQQVSGKKPMQVAVSIAGQLIALASKRELEKNEQLSGDKGVHWKAVLKLKEQIESK